MAVRRQLDHVLHVLEEITADEPWLDDWCTACDPQAPSHLKCVGRQGCRWLPARQAVASR